MKKIFLFLCFILSIACFSQTRVMDPNIKYYTEKAQNFLDKEKGLSDYYTIDKDGIKIFASAKDKLNGKYEFFSPWGQQQILKNHFKYLPAEKMLEMYKKGSYNDQTVPFEIYSFGARKISTEKKLLGYKIAIDPGHIANDHVIGDLEKKHIKFKADSAKGITDSIEISEGMLTIATAKLLKAKLEEQGAEVLLTRVNDLNAFGISFDEWIKTSYASAVDSMFKIGKFTAAQKQWLFGPKATDRDKFREVFKDIELEKRAQLINNFQPAFTIVIHYNVDETNFGWDKASSKNFNMTFVGGAFMKTDLASPEKRFEFLRLLVTDDLEQSITLSSEVVKQFEINLNVKTAKITDAKYLSKGCLPTAEKGVYCRNLQLPRYVHSPVVYGETLYQDNTKECMLLNKESDKTKNERVKQVAESYYQGILNYIEVSNKK